jgi:hypothetical protein
MYSMRQFVSLFETALLLEPPTSIPNTHYCMRARFPALKKYFSQSFLEDPPATGLLTF